MNGGQDLHLILLMTIEWLVVPFVLLGVLYYGFVVFTERVHDPKVREASRAGGWAGLVVFSLFVISQRNREIASPVSTPDYEFDLLPTVAATAVAFVVIWSVTYIRRSKAAGLFVLAVSASSSIAMYSYLFIPEARSTVVFLALGTALGVLLERVALPHLIEETEETAQQTAPAESSGQRPH